MERRLAGATVTTVLLSSVTTRGILFGPSNPASAYGAAASLALILIWIYYASMMILFVTIHPLLGTMASPDAKEQLAAC